jgi:hypothetical protein
MKPIFYTGTSETQNSALVDVCLDYFLSTSTPARMATIDHLPASMRVSREGSHCTLAVKGTFSEILSILRHLKG